MKGPSSNIPVKYVSSNVIFPHVKGSQTSLIPQVLKINTLALEEVQNVEIFKLAKYQFPKVDLGPNEIGQIEIPKEKSLEYLLNLCSHRVTPELKLLYDEMCQRDTFFPEISANGIQATKFDLKVQTDRYKRAKKKAEYVAGLRGPNSIDFGNHMLPGKQTAQQGSTESSRVLGAKQADLSHVTCMGPHLQNFVQLSATSNISQYDQLLNFIFRICPPLSIF